MKKIPKQPIATTSVDRHGDQISFENLKQLYEQLPERWVLNNNHDLSKPPLGLGYNKHFGKLNNEIWAIFIDVEVWDEQEFNKMGGFSISYTRNKITRNPNRAGEIEILFNPMFFIESEISPLINLSNNYIQIDGVELVQKGLEIPFVLVLKFISYSFFAGFIGKIGANTCDSLINQIKHLAKEKTKQSADVPKTQFVIPTLASGKNTEVLININIEYLEMIKSEREILLDLINKTERRNQNLKKIVIDHNYQTMTWELTHCIGHENNIFQDK